MPVVTYSLSPARVIDVSFGDISAQKLKGSNAVDPNALVNFIGRANISKNQYDYGALWSFDLDIPIDAKINSVKLNTYSAGTSPGTNFRLSGGFIKPRTSPNVPWQEASGFLDWDVESKFPWPEWDFGANTDLTVYEGDDAGFTNVTAVTEATLGNTWSVGDGQSPDNLVPTTFSAQLESYLDTYESTRGDRVVDAIPVCLVMFRPHVSLANNSYQRIGTESYYGAPTLTVDYTRLVPTVTITAPPDGTTINEGDSVTFTATAVDGNDVDISSGVDWGIGESTGNPYGLHTGASYTTNLLPVGNPNIWARTSWSPPWLPASTYYGYDDPKTVEVLPQGSADGHGSSNRLVSGDGRLDRLASGRAKSARLISGNGRIV